jgi:hypothetical protein
LKQRIWEEEPLYILGQDNSSKLEQQHQFFLRDAEKLIKAGADLTTVNNEGKTSMKNEFVQLLSQQKPQLF